MATSGNLNVGTDQSVYPTDSKVQKMKENDEESMHFHRIVNSFKYYQEFHVLKLMKKIDYYESMDYDLRSKLTKYRNHLDKIKECLDINSQLMAEIVKDVHKMYENKDFSHENDLKTKKATKWIKGTKPTLLDMDKTASIIRQLHREWSSEGKSEREESFTLIIKAINDYHKYYSKDIVKYDFKILIPGAGLGRLMYELTSIGYSTEGNEMSLFMIFTSNFILNKIKGQNVNQVCPWVHDSQNVLNHEDQVKTIRFPDMNPADVPRSIEYSMTAGNFLDVYKNKPNQFDCVATCFFIDTGNNVLDYIRTIYNILRPNGIWVNLGPLLYHFHDSLDQKSIEPSYDMVKEMIKDFNFQLIQEKTDVKCRYTQNSNSMLSYVYNCVFFVARKT